MREKNLMKISAILVVLMIITSCIAPCIAGVNSTNNASSNHSEEFNATMTTIPSPLPSPAPSPFYAKHLPSDDARAMHAHHHKRYGHEMSMNENILGSNVSLSSNTIYVPDDFAKIQWAVDNASAGDIIMVHSGTYYENVNVTKQLTLQGVDTSGGKPVVDAMNLGSAITLSVDGIMLDGFCVSNSSSRVSIIDWPEITGAGIKVISNDNNLTNNTAINNNGIGIFIWKGYHNTLIGNSASNNEAGIDLYQSKSNTLRNNQISDNHYNFAGQFENDIDTSNTVDGKPIYYLVGVSDVVIGSDSNAGTVYLFNCKNITIKDLDLTKNAAGIYLRETSNSYLLNNHINNNANGIWLIASNFNNASGNKVSNNGLGIYLYSSSNNNIVGNTAVNNNGIGIYLHRSSSSNNLIYNNYFSNTNNARDDGNNIWNITKTLGTNIIGGPYLGGNYWSDYYGEDLDGDGLGDTLLPYNSFGDIVNGGDYLPLTTGVTPTPKVYISSEQDFMERKYVANGSFSSSPSDMTYRLDLRIYANSGQFVVPRVVIFNTTSINLDRTFYKVDGVSMGHGNITAFPDHIEWTGNNETVSSEFELGVHELNTHKLTPPFSSSRLVEKEVFEGNETIKMTFSAIPTDNLNGLEFTTFAKETGDAYSELLVDTATNPEFIFESSSERIRWYFKNPVIGQRYLASVNLAVTPKTDSTTRYWTYTKIVGNYGSYTYSTSGSSQSMVEYTDSILGDVQIYFETPVDYSIEANGKGHYFERFKHFSEIVEGGEPNTIGIGGNAYKPGVRTVPVGTTVKWTNREELAHTVTSDIGLWNSGSLSRGQSFYYTFNTPGTYTYHDALHPSVTGVVKVYPTDFFFDTGEGTYPSIMGRHEGTITPSRSISVSRLYTYPCTGTGGHSEYVAFYYPNGTLIAEANWTGYSGDWHNISFLTLFSLEAGKAYNYTIRTGSYPQIIHNQTLTNTYGTINCTKFMDANGKEYNDWIPAIMLWGDKNE